MKALIRIGKINRFKVIVRNDDNTPYDFSSVTNLTCVCRKKVTGQSATLTITASSNNLLFQQGPTQQYGEGEYDIHISWKVVNDNFFLDYDSVFTLVGSTQEECGFVLDASSNYQLEGVISTGSGGVSSFNDLSNRPSYAGSAMTGETSIPAVPTKTSDLTNDSGFITEHQSLSDYYKKSEVDSAISGHHDNTKQDKIDSAHKLSYNLLSDTPPIPSKTSDLYNDSGFITKSVNDLINYYKTTETYTQAEVQQLISAIKQFTYEVVAVLPTASTSTMNKIYLVPSTSSQQGNVKDEYITLDNGASAETRYTWEQIGSTSIDLSNYVTTQQLNTALLNYVTSSSLATTLANYSTTSQMNSAISAHHDSSKISEPSQEGTNGQVLTTDGQGGRTWTTVQGGGGGSSQWGGITGDIDNQIDLKYRLEEIEETYNSEAQPLVCGQPMVIFGAGAISADNIPFNWIDAEHGGYDWGGQAAFAGQIYVNILGNNSNNKYVACPSTKGGYDLTWK